MYLPFELILNTNHFAPIRSPCESNLMGWPMIEVGSLVYLIAASTFLRVGVCPDLHTEAIA